MPARHLLGLADLDRAEVVALVDRSRAEAAGAGGPRLPLVVGLLFFEESTRTRVGFEVAAARLGGQAVVVAAPKHTPTMSASESWDDLVRSIGPYFDVLCVRHRDPAAPRQAATLVDVPVVNCGNGTDEHPTQALIDLLAIADHLGRAPDGVRVTLVGDLLHMRTAHSLVLALSLFDNVTVTAISPSALALPTSYVRRVREAGLRFNEGMSLDDGLDADVIYMAGFAPRTADGVWDDGAREPFRLTARRASQLSPEAAVLCPLPRIDEIDRAVDALPQSRYFRQSQLGLAVRSAVLRHLVM